MNDPIKEKATNVINNLPKKEKATKNVMKREKESRKEREMERKRTLKILTALFFHRNENILSKICFTNKGLV